MRSVGRWAQASVTQRIARILWAALLITIPVTSFPLISKTIGNSVVSPLAGAPLLLLALLWFLPLVLSGRDRMAGWLPIVGFVLLAALSTSLVLFYQIYPFLGQTPLERSVRGLLTLGAGVGFYFVASEYARSTDALRFTLRCVYIGAVIAFLWSSVQILVLFRSIATDFQNTYIRSGLINEIHRFFSVRDLFSRRVTGLAYEPSWLANQLVILYLPLLIASVLQRYSAWTVRRTRLSVELGLLGWGILILFFSQSRIGYLSFFAMFAWIIFQTVWRLSGQLIQRRGAGFKEDRDPDQPHARTWMRIVVLIGIAAFLLGSLWALLRLASTLDQRLAKLFEIDFVSTLRQYDEPVYALASKLKYAERLVYWQFGFRVFSMYPLLGVGLGNAGFFFRETVPAYAAKLPEMISILNGAKEFPNPKSLWVRLLAETGIAGTLLFAIWIGAVVTRAGKLVRTSNPTLRVIGAAGGLALIAQIFEGFSLDTFALPQLWIITGLVTAASTLIDPVETGGGS
jgi:hypothetical protein